MEDEVYIILLFDYDYDDNSYKTDRLPLYDNCINKMRQTSSYVYTTWLPIWLNEIGYDSVSMKSIKSEFNKNIYVPAMQFTNKNQYLKFLLEFS